MWVCALECVRETECVKESGRETEKEKEKEVRETGIATVDIQLTLS